jgi:hypothetical protein
MATSRLLVARVHGLAGRRAALGDLAAATLGERGCRRFDLLEFGDPGEHLLLVASARWAALQREHADVLDPAGDVACA